MFDAHRTDAADRIEPLQLRPLTDTQVVFLACVAVVLVRSGLPVGVPLAIVGLAGLTSVAGVLGIALGRAGGAVALVRRRLFVVALLAVFAALVCGRRAQLLEDRAVPSSVVEAGSQWEFVGTLRSDPSTRNGITSAVVVVDGRRYRLQARGKVGTQLGRREAGHRIRGVGKARVKPEAAWRIAKHLSADVDLRSLHVVSKGSVVARFANGLRHTLTRSSHHFSRTNRALFQGFVLGDGREQPVWVTDDFRAAGLSHLLVVSGQNVAFTLAVVRPFLRRLRLRGRFVVTMVVLFVFSAVTRFEPSVMRAAVMAALSCGAVTVGRTQRSIRVLALSVCVLTVYDPLLAWSVGFGLSVGACVGLALITPRLEEVLRGPSWLRNPLATTLGAQAGASVISVPLFGDVPIASLPANLLAFPAAEPVMAWGVLAGVPSGLVAPWLGDWPARLVHIPTQACLWWVQRVAAFVTSHSLGSFGGFALLALAAALMLRWRGIRYERRSFVRVAAGVLVVTVGLGFVRAPRTLVGSGTSVARGVTAYGVRGHLSRGVAVLIIEHGASADQVLEGLRRYRVSVIDLVVVASGGRPQAHVVEAIAARRAVGAVLVGERGYAAHVRPAIDATPGMVINSSNLVVIVDTVINGRLSVRVERSR